MTLSGRQLAFRRIFLLLVLGTTGTLAHAGIGDIDPSYGINGKFAGYGGASQISILPDGRVASAIYIDGTLCVQMATTDGAPDASFGPNDAASVDDAGCGASGERVFSLGLGRGTVSFGQSGPVLIGLPGGDILVAFAAQPQSAVAGPNDAYMVRIGADGALNTSFGTQGIWRSPGVGEWGTAVQAIQAQSDGRILLVLASFDTPYGCARSLQLRRLMGDGSADAQFGQGGVVSFEPACFSVGDMAISLLPGGYIVADLDGDTGATLLDSSGIATRAPTADLQSRLASFQQSAVIPGTSLGYIAGASQTSPTVFSIERLTSSLTPDTTFGATGTGAVNLELGPTLGPASLAPGTPANAPAGHIYGLATDQQNNAVFRMNNDGTIDPQFGSDGVVTLGALGGGNVTGTLEQSNGDLLLAINGVGVVRLLGSAVPSPGLEGFSENQLSVTQGAASVTLTVGRSLGSNGAVSVSFHTEDGSTALAGVDYQATTGTLEWADGDASDRHITIKLLNGPTLGNALPFYVVLDSPGGSAPAGPSSAAVYIDPPAASAPVVAPTAASGGGGAINELTLLTLLTLAGCKLTMGTGTAAPSRRKPAKRPVRASGPTECRKSTTVAGRIVCRHCIGTTADAIPVGV